MSEREMEDMLDEVFRKVLGERWRWMMIVLTCTM